MSPPRALAPRKSRELSPLAVARELENLEHLYVAWAQLQSERRAANEARRLERDRLTTRAGYLLNAVSAARAFSPGSAAPTPPGKQQKGKKPRGSAKALAAVSDPLQDFHAKAEAELRDATAKLDAREKQEEETFGKQDREIRTLVLERAAQHLKIHKPRLALAVHPVGPKQVIVQADRIGEEDAVLLVRLLCGRLPTQWGFFTNDHVDDLGQQAPRLFGEGAAATPLSVDEEDLALLGEPDFAPARLQIPIRVPGHDFPRFRLIHRGPVAELESRREAAPYSQLIPQADAELLTGFLLSLKLAGALQLDVEVG
jgi:hypothetical protein